MRLLVLGGTIFLGRHVVEAARARGHEVTLFNRGRHNPELFPDLEKLRGDRDGDLGALDGRAFDAVIDTCGYVPRVVRQSAQLLASSHYTLVSSLSVYADNETAGDDETAQLMTLADPDVEEIKPETYGGLKAASEREVPHGLVVRPGLIVGPHDPTDRFTYWPVRLARPGTALVPGPRDAPLECTDVRDLAAWIVVAAEQRLTGAYNVSGKTTRAELFEACAGPETKLAWADWDWLMEREVIEWVDLPACVAGAGFSTRSEQRALDAGLVHRPIADTVRDTRAWAGDRELSAGLDAAREAALLAELTASA